MRAEHEDFAIDYPAGLAELSTNDLEVMIAYLLEELPSAWCNAYEDMVGHRTSIYQFSDGSFQVLYDLSHEVTEVPPEEAVEERVVAVFGRSIETHEKRNPARWRECLRGAHLNRIRLIGAREELVRMDRGHYMAHTMGGRIDVNLFLQRREINRGWSERGKVYRKMERFGAEHPGTFCFSRPIYRDRTWIPREIEYGVLRGVGDLWVERFEN